jgi:hypothetical protein
MKHKLNVYFKKWEDQAGIRMWLPNKAMDKSQYLQEKKFQVLTTFLMGVEETHTLSETAEVPWKNINKASLILKNSGFETRKITHMRLL